MLLFAIVFLGAVLALLIVQSMDIENETPRIVRRKPAQENSFPPYAAMREVR